MFKSFRSRAAIGAAVLGLVAGGAQAAGEAAIDVTDVVSTITAQQAPIGLIGVAVLSLTVLIAAYKWVRRAL